VISGFRTGLPPIPCARIDPGAMADPPPKRQRSGTEQLAHRLAPRAANALRPALSYGAAFNDLKALGLW
jgi:hypothetical protein